MRKNSETFQSFKFSGFADKKHSDLHSNRCSKPVCSLERMYLLQKYRVMTVIPSNDLIWTSYFVIEKNEFGVHQRETFQAEIYPE